MTAGDGSSEIAVARGNKSRQNRVKRVLAQRASYPAN